MYLLKFWTIDDKHHRNIPVFDDAFYKKCQQNPAVGKRSIIFPPATNILPEDQVTDNTTKPGLKKLLDMSINPFDISAEELHQQCLS